MSLQIFATILLVIGCLLSLSVDARETTADVASSLSIGISPFTRMLHTRSASRKRRALIPGSQMAKIGNCTFDKYTYNVMACATLLYRGYRENPVKKTCRDQIPRYLNCTTVILHSCISNPYIIQMAERTMKSTLKSMNFTQVACDEGGYSDNLPVEIIKSCKSEIKSDYIKCVTPFRKMYKADPGSPKLCAENKIATDCSVDAIARHCSGDLAQKTVDATRALNAKSSNPFCSVEQGGANPDRIITGKLYGLPVNGASSLTLPISTIFLCFVLFINFMLIC